jgi:hypothetical protein
MSEKNDGATDKKKKREKPQAKETKRKSVFTAK